VLDRILEHGMRERFRDTIGIAAGAIDRFDGALPARGVRRKSRSSRR